MPFFSISLKRDRAGEPKTTFNVGELEPTSGRAIELRIDTEAYRGHPGAPPLINPVQFTADLERLLLRMFELREPRPEFATGVSLDGIGWEDIGGAEIGWEDIGGAEIGWEDVA